MSSLGIRISDKKSGVISVNLSDLLEEVEDGNVLHWSVLDVDATGDLGEKTWAEIDKSESIEKGFLISWSKLNTLASKLWDIWDLTLIGVSKVKCLKRYKSEEIMHNSCDIVIVMFDSSYWEVFSKDHGLIYRLEKKFKDTELLKTN